MEPINYGLGTQNPMQAFQSALTMGNTMLQSQQAAEINALSIRDKTLAIQAKEEEAKKQAEIDAIFEKLKQPGATAKDYMNLAMLLPKDASEAVVKSFQALKAEERQAALTDSAQVFSALKVGRTDLAVQIIRRQAEAERSAGNEPGAILAEEWAKMAESGPEGAKAVEDMLGFTIANLPGGDKAIEGVVKLEQNAREAELFPVLTAQRDAELAKAKSDAEVAAINAKYAEQIAKAKVAKDEAEASTAQEELRTLPARRDAELATAKSDAEIAAINAKYAERKAAAETKLAELGVDFKSTEFKTYADLKAAELALAKDDAAKAAIELKYADPLQAAQLLLTQGNAQATQISLKTLEEAKKLELSAAKTAGEIAAVEAKYAERIAAAQLLLTSGQAETVATTNKSLADLKAEELKQAKTQTERDAITLKYADPLQAAQLLLAQGQAKAVEITNINLADLKKQELAKATSEAEVAAVEAKYADPLQAAQVLLAQGKATELTTILLTLGDEKKQALAKATSEASKAAIEAEFALRVSQASLDQQLATLGLTKDQADKTKVDKAIAEAKEAREVKVFPNEEARITAEVKIAQSKATIAEIDAKYADKIKIAELEQMAQDLGLTIAQKNRAIVEGKKISADTAKVLMEAENLKKNGGMDPEKLFNLENTVRKEFNSRTAEVNELRQTYDKIGSSAKSNTPAGDVALVFAFMRMLDPTSVVRESEFAVAQDTTGLYGKLSLLYPKLVSGQRLTEQQKSDFVNMSGKYMEASLQHEERVKADLGVVVKNYGLNPANVFGTGSPDTPPATPTTVEVEY